MFLNPLPLSETQLAGGRCPRAQGCCRLPDTPLPSLYRYQGGNGHDALGLSSNLSPMPSHPVVYPPVPTVSTDGAGSVASPAILSHSHPGFPALDAQNGHFPAFTPSLPATSCSPSPPTASLGVTASGPPIHRETPPHRGPQSRPFVPGPRPWQRSRSRVPVPRRLGRLRPEQGHLSFPTRPQKGQL